MKEVAAFFGRLTSRKFLLTVFGLIGVTLYPEGSTAIVTLIGTFVAAEGAADTVERYAEKKFDTQPQTTTPQASAAQVLDDEPDFTGAIVPGSEGGTAPL